MLLRFSAKGPFMAAVASQLELKPYDLAPGQTGV